MTDYLNDPNVTPIVRRPRLRVLANGDELTGAKSASTTQNNWYAADRFRAEFAMSAPNAKLMNWWGNQDTILLDIQMQLDESDFVSVLQGEVDRIEIMTGTQSVHVEGRDLSARFIDAKTQESFSNKTSSGVVKILAARHGLSVDLHTTTTLVERYYSDNHTHETASQFSRTTTEWDLMVFLASREGFDLYVSGSTLYFHPQASMTATPWLARWTQPIATGGASNGQDANVIDLRTDRALTLAKDIVVDVESWDSKKGRGFHKSAPIGVGASSVRSGKATRYTYVFPNLTEADAQAWANSLYADLVKHERNISFRTPGDLVLNPRHMVELTGTNSSWDTRYFVDEVTRDISYTEGFVMSVRAKNQTSSNQSAL